MSYAIWLRYLAVNITIGFIDGIYRGVLFFMAASDVNSGVTYQVDQIASGSGFLSLIRVAGTFFIDLLPKLITWNYLILQGILQPVQYIGIAVFSVAAIVTLGNGVLGLLRRNTN